MRFFIFTLTFCFAFTVSFAEEEQKRNWAEPTSAQIEYLKQGIVDYSDLKDPFSIKLKKIHFYEDVLTGVNVFCGWLNAKNSFGGYAGWTRFTAQDISDREGDEKGHWKIFIYQFDADSKLMNEMQEIALKVICEGYNF